MEVNNLLEEELSSADRKKLKDSTFGLPAERKYPLNDPQHVISAITYFGKCPKEKRKELASNINAAIKKFKMSPKVSVNNPFYDYYNK